MKQRALEQSGLRRHFAIGQDFERAAHDRESVRDRRDRRGDNRPILLDGRGSLAPIEVLVGDEFVAVPLQDHAGEGAAADDKHFLVVLFEFFDERKEVAVATDDDVRVDVLVGEHHFERVERQVDVGAVLVAARCEVALHEPDGVLRQMPAVLAGARPVRVGNLRDHLAAFLDAVEHDPDVEMFVEGAFDADLDVVEVDEYRDVETILVRQNVFPGENAVNANPDLRAGSSRNCSSRVFRSARVGRRQVTCRAIVPQLAGRGRPGWARRCA